MPPTWILNATGLCIGVVAALLMFYYPPMLPRYTRDGRRLTKFVDKPTEQGRRIARRQARYSTIAPLMLALSFLLQLLAALAS